MLRVLTFTASPVIGSKRETEVARARGLFICPAHRPDAEDYLRGILVLAGFQLEDSELRGQLPLEQLRGSDARSAEMIDRLGYALEVHGSRS